MTFFPGLLRRSVGIIAVAVASACNAGSVPATYAPPLAPLFGRAGISSCASQTCVYVTDNAGTGQHPHDNKVVAFSHDADGNVPPVAQIAGPKSRLPYPRAVALDASRNIYVSNFTPLQKLKNIDVFAAGSTGNAAPLRTIAGAATQLHAPGAISVDGAGNIYALDQYGATSGCFDPTHGCWTINVYAAGAAGNVAPLRSIRGPATKLYYAYGIATDGAGNAYVADGYPINCCVSVYAAGSSGNVKPTRTIEGSKTALYVPVGIALDSAGSTYVLNAEGSPTRSVTVYAAGAKGNVKPIRMIVGQKTGLYAAPVGIAVDRGGRLYVLQSGTENSISVFAPGANGNVAPIRVITGSKTAMTNPWSIAAQ